MDPQSTPDTLTAEEKHLLLAIARESIESFLKTASLRPLASLSPQLLRPGGCFVTLHKRGQLRGCIGKFADETGRDTTPLARIVQLMVVEAATGDPRFLPVRPEELPEIRIDISVLSPSRKIGDPREVCVGRDGLIISRGPRRGVLLPQVAVEQKWDRETFLSQTCVKAGLPPNAWQDPDVRIEAFTAQVFSEQRFT